MKVLQARRARQTGLTVLVVDNRWGRGRIREEHPMFEGGPWVTVCEAHGSFGLHSTRRIAVYRAADPESWCRYCREVAPWYVAQRQSLKDIDTAHCACNTSVSLNGKEVVMNIDVSTLEERVAELDAEQIREQFQSLSEEPTDELIEDNDQGRS